MRFISRYRILVKLILVLLLVITLCVFYISRKQQLLWDFKNLLEKETEIALGRKVTIKNISGGLLRPITLWNVAIAYSKSNANQYLFKAKTIRVNKRLWDVLIRRQQFTNLVLDLYDANLYPFGNLGPKIEKQKGRIVFSRYKERMNVDLTNRSYHLKGEIFNIYKEPTFNLDLKIKSTILDGRFILGGTSKQPNIRGALNIYGMATLTLSDFPEIEKKRIRFNNLYLQDKYLTKGEIDLGKNEAIFKIYLNKQEKANIVFEQTANMHFKIRVGLNHLKIKNQDFVADIISDVKLNKTKDDKFKNIQADVATETLILNYKPLDNIKGSFSWNKGLFKINELTMGHTYLAKGFICFKKPKTIDLNIKINNLEIKDASKFYSIPDDFIFLSTINSTINLTGNFKKPKISARFSSTGGQWQDIKFKSANLDLEGTYPILLLKNSKINREGSYLILDGFVDLRKIKSDNIIEDLVIKSDKQTIVWEGWDITKKRNSPNVSLKKSIGKDFSLLYKNYVEDEIGPNERSKNEIELNYKILNNKSLKMRLKEDEEFFGLENKIKF